nr:hypothetical protein [Tanacetum cinerariifolium]
MEKRECYRLKIHQLNHNQFLKIQIQQLSSRVSLCDSFEDQALLALIPKVVLFMYLVLEQVSAMRAFSVTSFSSDDTSSSSQSYVSTMRPLFLPEDEIGAEALEVMRANLALTLLYLASKSLVCLGLGLYSESGEALVEKVTDMKEMMSLTNSLLQNDPSYHISGIQFGQLLLYC